MCPGQWASGEKEALVDLVLSDLGMGVQSHAGGTEHHGVPEFHVHLCERHVDRQTAPLWGPPCQYQAL